MSICGDCNDFGTDKCAFSYYNPLAGSTSCGLFIEAAFAFSDDNSMPQENDYYIDSEEQTYLTDEEVRVLLNSMKSLIKPSTKKDINDHIKTANSDGRTQCCACGRQIVEPYPGIRYCQNCEG